MADRLNFDTIVIGGGTAGCVLADRLSEDRNHRVAVIEAGPDFGHAGEGRWPTEIASAGYVPTQFDWGYKAELSGRPQPYTRGKIVGGSSAINATGINWGLRRDYDDWERLGNSGWGFDGLLPFFQKAEQLANDDPPLRGKNGKVTVTRSQATSPYIEDVIRSYERAGVGWAEDSSGPDAAEGMGCGTRNALDGERFHSARAYLDGARGRNNLTILADTQVDRLIWSGGKVEAVAMLRDGERVEASGDRIVLCGGAIGSPIVLQRSAIGDATLLRRLIGPDAKIHELPGVGKNLHDHFGVRLQFHTVEGVAGRFEQPKMSSQGPSISLRLKSNPALDAFDLDVFAAHWAGPQQSAGEMLAFMAFLIHPVCEGHVAITSIEPAAPPEIDMGFEEPADFDALARGIEWLRDRARDEPLRKWVVGEASPGAAIEGAELRRWVRDNAQFFFHVTGTCKMGPASDRMAVVDASGRVRGFENLYVADASIMPTIPRGMIIMTVYAIAEKIAAGLQG